MTDRTDRRDDLDDRRDELDDRRDELDDLPEMSISDPEEAARDRSRERLLDLADNVAEARADALAGERVGRWTESEATLIYRTAFEALLLELEPLVKEAGREHLWNEKPFGTTPVHPPQDVVNPDAVSIRGYDLDPIEIQFRGLRDFLQKPAPLEVVWTVEKTPDHKLAGQVRKETVECEALTPSKFITHAHRETRQFMSDIGLDIEVNTGDGTAEADYSDIL